MPIAASSPQVPRPGRLHGPGGLYTAGNLIGLGTALVAATLPGATAPVAAVAHRDAGLLLIAAYVLFLWSGEIYWRAWGPRPSVRLIRQADAVSAAGALVLALALFRLGGVQVAVCASLVHAAARFGSSLMPGARLVVALPGLPPVDPLRLAVMASRLPAIADLAAALAVSLAWGATAFAVLVTAVLLVRLALCLAADAMLLRLSLRPPPGTSA